MAIESTKSFTWNGIDFSGDDYQVYLVNRDRFGYTPDLPQPRVDVQGLSGSSGAVTQGATWEAERLVLECAMVAADSTARETKLLAIRTALEAAQEGEKYIIFGLRTGYKRLVRLVRVSPFVRKGNGALFTLEFVWPYPFEESV